MKSIVFQSFRTTDVPAWVSTCMGTVRGWAAHHGFDYRFWDDGFFDLIPPELRPRASIHKCLLADYARIVAGRDLLAAGYDRAIWVDADVVVFNPQGFTIPFSAGVAFCREVWLDRVSFGFPQFQLTANNAVSVLCRGETFSRPYLESADSILAGNTPLTPFSIGTQWLLKRHQLAPFPLLTNVGIFGPEMAGRYLSNDGRFLKPYLRFQTSPVSALNLCLSKAEPGPGAGRHLSADTAQTVIDRLLADRGESLNRWYVAGGQRPKHEAFGRPLSRYLALRATVKRLVGRGPSPVGS